MTLLQEMKTMGCSEGESARNCALMMLFQPMLGWTEYVFERVRERSVETCCNQKWRDTGQMIPCPESTWLRESNDGSIQRKLYYRYWVSSWKIEQRRATHISFSMLARIHLVHLLLESSPLLHHDASESGSVDSRSQHLIRSDYTIFLASIALFVSFVS